MDHLPLNEGSHDNICFQKKTPMVSSASKKDSHHPMRISFWRHWADVAWDSAFGGRWRQIGSWEPSFWRLIGSWEPAFRGRWYDKSLLWSHLPPTAYVLSWSYQPPKAHDIIWFKKQSLILCLPPRKSLMVSTDSNQGLFTWAFWC